MADEYSYVEKPKKVEARLFSGSTAEMTEVTDWIKANGYIWYDAFTPPPANGITFDVTTGYLWINTPDGLRLANRGDYLVKDASGVIRPMKPDVFVSTYEPTTF